jgi:hypothetical protein
VNSLLDRIRLRGDRPARSMPTGRVALIVLAAAVVAVAFTRGGGDRQPRQAVVQQRATRSTPEEPPAVRGPSRLEVRAAKRAARRFTRGYVRFTYDQLPASRIPDVAEDLWRRIAADPPRVPAAVRRRHVHIARMTLQADDATPRRMSFLALVSDESTLTVTAVADSGWHVTAIDVGQ